MSTKFIYIGIIGYGKIGKLRHKILNQNRLANNFDTLFILGTFAEMMGKIILSNMDTDTDASPIKPRDALNRADTMLSQPWKEYLYMNELLNNFFSQDTPTFKDDIHHNLYYIIPKNIQKTTVGIYVNFRVYDIIYGGCNDDVDAEKPPGRVDGANRRDWHTQRNSSSLFTPRDAFNSIPYGQAALMAVNDFYEIKDYKEGITQPTNLTNSKQRTFALNKMIIYFLMEIQILK